MSVGVNYGLIVLGGVLSGLFTAPFAYTKGWEWENKWFIYSIYGNVLVPWIICLFTINDPIRVFMEASTQSIAMGVGLGMIWGIGSCLFGIGVDMVGNALGFALILGLTSALGAALPLVILHPDAVKEREGTFTWIGLAIVIIGLVFLAFAGKRKDREQSQPTVPSTPPSPPVQAPERQRLLNHPSDPYPLPKPDSAKSSSPSFLTGLIVCLLSGVFSPALNFAITFGGDVTAQATKYGTDTAHASNAIWALAVSGGSIINLGYSAFKLTRNKTWPLFFHPQPSGLPVWNALLCSIAGACWFGGNGLYGTGAQLIGDLGNVIGWPIFMCSMIIASSVFGFAQGEWHSTSIKTRLVLLGGLVVLLVAVVVIGLGPLHS
eukprot:m.180640 g.180640  ORF g.180640 m.180640 type:complete len:377 (+) comp14653_c0_seq31:84-1214(+)